MRHLSIDIETFSSVDLKKCGMYKYAQSPDFEVLLFAYSFGREVCVIDVKQNEEIPPEIISSLVDSDTVKHAYNAAFEWYCLSLWLGINLPIDQWRCTMAHGLYCGYPGGLGAIGEAIGLALDKKKMSIGMSLIRTFCCPNKPTATNGNRTRTLPWHEKEKWELFKKYCARDVVAEMEIGNILQEFPMPISEQKLWELDVKINCGGVAVDLELIEGALEISGKVTGLLMQEAVNITGLKNPKSVKQLTDWLGKETDEEVVNLTKSTVENMLKNVQEGDVKRVLEIRQELGKTSVTKYGAMNDCVCRDGRIRGLLQFYGANRTGRWAGRMVQVQNLPRNYLPSLGYARELVKCKKLEHIRVIYGNIPDTLSQLIRTAFVPKKGCVFVVADFSAIEARVIAWLAKESWRQEVFATHGKIYEASAAAMFGVEIGKIKKGNPEYELRQKGKIAELALGYQGGAGALKQMGALEKGLKEDELPDIVQRWREANKRIVELWKTLENAAITTVKTGGATGVKGLIFAIEQDYKTSQNFFTIRLPSGRKLFYANPVLAPNDWGKPSMWYMGTDQKTRKWTQLPTYGGKITENVVQAIARDCLAEALKRLEGLGFKTVMHIHDEVVLEVNSKNADLESVCKIMCEPIAWAPDLLLKADGFICDYYKKE